MFKNMNKTLIAVIIGIGATVSTSSIALAENSPKIQQDERIVIWEGTPIRLEIPLGQERRIDFPEPIVELNVKPEEVNLSEMMLTPTGTLLWKPNAPYDSIRTRAISMTGAHYIVDFSASAEEGYGSTRTVKIVDPLNSALSQSSKSNTPPTPPKAVPKETLDGIPLTADGMPVGMPDFLIKGSASKIPNFVQMSRFAMAHFTGPDRLIPKISNATMVNSYNPPKNWIRIFGDRIGTKTLRSWKIHNFYVTAVMLQNKSPMPLEFDPRSLRGEYVYSAVMNPLLQARGNVGDESLVILITKLPFQDAVKK